MTGDPGSKEASQNARTRRVLLSRLRAELREIAAIPDETERLLEVAAIIDEALVAEGHRPVIVGGLAIAYWSDGEFTTPDIDAVIPHTEALVETMDALGFVRRGREWVLPGFEVIFEAPGTALEARDRPNRVSLRSGRSVFVLSPEDALLWRLREWIHWRSSSAFRQAAYLLGSSQLDRGRLDARAREEGLASALTMLAETVARLAAGEQLEDREIADIGRQVERESYRKSDDIDS